METYFRVRLTQVNDTFEDILTTHAFEFGANGVSEALNYIQRDLNYDPSILPTRSHELDVFFNEKPSDDFFTGITKLNPQVRWSIHQEETKDWLEEWKKGFVAFKLTGPFWVVPSWLEKPKECEKPLYIDPGMAFGTGTHATTQLAAYFVNKVSEKFQGKNASLLDVGTGTGILAMLGRQAGFVKVMGLEIDPEARRTARQNIELNKCDNIEIPDKPIEETGERFDVVVANIIDGVLVHLKNDLIRTTKPGGYLILTGILKERDSQFFEKFLETDGLKVDRRLEKDEWVGYLVQKI